MSGPADLQGTEMVAADLDLLDAVITPEDLKTVEWFGLYRDDSPARVRAAAHLVRVLHSGDTWVR